MASYPLVAVAICELTVISHFIHTLFWAQMQENASIPFFFHILTSPLNSIYLCSLWGLFYSGWKKKLIFVPSLLPYGSPSPLLFPALSANPIVSPSPLLSSAFLSFFSFLHFSITVPSHSLLSPILTYRLIPFSPWLPLPSPKVLFPHLPLSAPLSHFLLWSLQQSSPLISSPVFALPSLPFLAHPSLSSYLLSCPAPVFRSIRYTRTPPRLFIFSLFLSPRTPHPPRFLPSRPFTSPLLSSDSASCPKATSLNGEVEKQNLDKAQGSALPVPSVCSSIHLFVFPRPSPLSLSDSGVCLTVPPGSLANTHTHTHTHMHAHTGSDCDLTER